MTCPCLMQDRQIRQGGKQTESYGSHVLVKHPASLASAENQQSQGGIFGSGFDAEEIRTHRYPCHMGIAKERCSRRKIHGSGAHSFSHQAIRQSWRSIWLK